MEATAHRAIAVVGVGAILPDAPDAGIFWNNVQAGRYSVSEVTSDRWDPRLYFDPDPKAPEKSYSKIGGWVRDWRWEPLAWGMRILPAVAEAMDDGQKWAVACTRQALADFGYPERRLDLDRTAVILGNAMAGEKHYMTALRVFLPEYAEALASAPSFGALPLELRQTINAELARSMRARLPDITEDTMPGELSNCIAGRVANLFNLRGPNYVVDAACASAMAAISAAIEGLDERDFDTVVAGGIDRNMGATAFVKFCKIGALSATGTRPYAAGADGFVMGEGAAVFLLKRLADAERDGDRVYAVIRGIGGSSDGKGKGITAPNPVGQKLAITRAWENAALSPASATLVEGHGTSTRVGDVVETQSLTEVFGASALPRGSIALGSVKSNIGHLKAAAGAAGLLKLVMALRDKVLPPSINFERPNPDIDFEHSPFAVNRELRPWDEPACGVRRAGLSAFGFGGTNFHLVLEEHVPGRLTGGRDRASVDVPDALVAGAPASAAAPLKPPLRGAVVVGAATRADLLARLTSIGAAAAAGRAPAVAPPAQADLRAAVRIAIDHGDAAELADKIDRAKKALAGDNPIAWKALRGQGIFLGEGPAPKVAFLYTGQGSQYVDMLKELVATEPLVAEVFAEADRVMTPFLGRPLTEYVFASGSDASALGEAEENLRQTAITQPAVLATDAALTKLLAAYGVVPDVVMGHSLGEYAALVAAGGLPFADALEAVSARGREMTNVSVADNGRMAAVMAPLKDVERILASIPGYVVIANLNSNQQAVIGGASAAVAEAIERFRDAGFGAVPLNVSHAFHTEIVAPASEPLRRTLERLRLAAPRVPVVANVDGQLYPSGPDARERMLDLLARQVASPVQFVAGLRTLHASGVRLFVEVGPKRALAGFVDDVFGGHADVVALHTNHPKNGDRVSFNQALCGLYAAGLGAGARAAGAARETAASEVPPPLAERARPASPPSVGSQVSLALDSMRLEDLGRMFADVLERGWQVYRGDAAAPAATPGASSAPVVVTGAALGLPGTERVFDDANVSRILHGQQLIDLIPTRFRRAILDKHITRLAKKPDGAASFETIDSPSDVIKLAGRAGRFDLGDEFGVALERIAALDTVTRLAIGAGLDALRDAGIPLVLRYKTTSKGTRLPDRWMLPEALRDETGVVFASAFPGLDSFAADIGRFHADRTRREKLAILERLRSRVEETTPSALRLLADLDEQIHELEAALDKEPFSFDRRFLFRILAMGHSQFAELIGARGPNTHVNAACASTTQAVAVAEDWIRQGRARRVIVVSGDDVTSDNLLEWIGSGFLASGAAATDDVVEDAAIPFDRRRHGMILGMGAAAFVVEDPAAARARGLRPICEVLSAVTANSAFHGTRLDVDHIAAVMETLVARAEQRHGIRREQIAPQTVFVSHETYTPARGGSAAAEVRALRQVFGAAADRVVIANTKGFTGHAMGVGIEDVVAIKALETGLIPPVANFKEADPELGHLNLSKGGVYPVQYALRLGAGFGSQISMTLCRWVASVDGSRPSPDQLGYRYRVTDPAAFRGWLDAIGGRAGAELEVVKRTLRVVDPETQERAAGIHHAPPAVAPGAARTAIVTRPAARARSDSAELEGPRATTAPPPRADDGVKERVLALFAEKTGYPRDMLAEDLDLEADLGIDTVKQAELFATVRETFAIPRDEKLKLRDFPTLGHVIGFVKERRPDLVSTPPAAADVSAGAVAQPPVGSPPVAPAAVAAPASAAADALAEQVLALFAEKTGYPRDMLDPDLDLEADLGIDTVKQAELFATVRETFAIPRDEKLKLRDFPTLGHVIGFVKERRPDLAAPPPAEPAVAVAPAAAGAPLGPSICDLSAANAIPRRVPTAVLRPSITLSKETGVSLGESQRVVVMPDAGGVAKALVRQLKKRGVRAVLLDPAATAAELEAALAEVLAVGPLTGIYWLPALDSEGDLASIDLAAWRAALALRVKLLYTTTRKLYEDLGVRGTFLVAATRLGGRHGYDDVGALHPLGGAVTGFTKTVKRERPQALVKAVDFEDAVRPSDVAQRLIDETLFDPGIVEVGWCGSLRFGVALEERAVTNGATGMELGRDSVFLVTGAAGGITSAIVADLAAASGGTFHLLDLVAAPDPTNPDLARFGTDKEGLKRELFERIKARGERATPALVEKELAVIERSLSALAAVRAVENAGGRAYYHRVDLRDAAMVDAACAEAKRTSGRIDVLLHAGGLEVSRFLPDKPPAEFDLIFDVKSDGWFNLMKALGDTPVGATVAFSSVAGRFGNGGQADYAAANDLLCKLTSNLRIRRPETRGLVIDWTAWSDIGMASRGSIPKMMAAAGIDMLPASAGIPIIRRELAAGASRGEIVIGLRLGVLVEEWDEHGGLDVDKVVTRGAGPMVGAVAGMRLCEGFATEVTLDPQVQPFLNDHRIDGTPVLPGVMGIEGFVELVRLVLPDWHVAAVEDVRFLAPCKFYRNEPRTLRLVAQFRAEGGEILADTRLVASRAVLGQGEPQSTTHFTARVRLSRTAPRASRVPEPPAPDPDRASAAASDVYRVYFHGPAYRVIDQAWRAGGGAAARFASDLPADREPPEQPLFAAPRLVELCFQAAGVWQLGTQGRMALPQAIESLTVHPGAEAPTGEVRAVTLPRTGGIDAHVVDGAGRTLVTLRGYRTIELPDPVDEAALAPLRAAMA